ncbi:MAG: SAM-dependent chlorinase/fluorinase [Pseudomonadota bacterium]
MPVISLLTDFGLSDTYVGIMKGVILSRAPEARIVDISHGILPQHLVKAAFLIDSAYRYFPKGTVHVVVVDPGVGSDRTIIVLEAAGYFFMAPNNGVLTMILEKTTAAKAVKVENRRFFLETVSRTFHGRDIFAPVAAYLSLGGDIHELGSRVAPSDLMRLPIPKPLIGKTGELIGVVIDIDRFGNLITNINEDLIQALCENSGPAVIVGIGGNRICDLKASYADVSPGATLAIIGSRGTLEISINRGRAKDFFSAAIGDQVTVLTGDRF